MAIRFKDTISINEEYTFPLEDGTVDQILATDGAGNISFVDVAGGEAVKIECKNTSGSTITKGTPVYVTGTVGTSFRVQIAPADASDSAKMPAVGLLETDLANNGEGYIITGGLLKNLTTDPIDGTNTTPNDTIYVKAGGGLTMTKPTGSDLIQNIGKVGRVNTANAGSIVVSSILRTNDIPNLTEGKIWVGSANNTIESTVVHIDETNTRVGIGTGSPTVPLEVEGTDAKLKINNTTNSTTDLVILDLTGIVQGSGTGNERAILLGKDGNAARQAKISYTQGTSNGQLPSLSFFTGDNVDSLDERMRIDSSGTVIVKNATTSGANIQLQSDNGTWTQNDVISNLNTYISDTSGSGARDVAAIKVINEQAGVNTTTSGAMAFYTSPYNGTVTERMRIDSSGNSTFYGNTLIDNGVDSTLFIGKGSEGVDGVTKIKSYQSGADTDQLGLQFYVHPSATGSASTELAMTIDHNKNVGIGTTSPDSTGYVNLETAKNIRINVGNVSADPVLYFSHDNFASATSNYITVNRADESMRFNVNDSERVRIDSSGNVLIGPTTTTPQKLEVFGIDSTAYSSTDDSAQRANGASICVTNNNGTTNSFAQLVFDTAGSNQSIARIVAIRTGTSSNDMAFVVEGGNTKREAMRIDSSGNVGIGTPNPATPLHVYNPAGGNATDKASMLSEAVLKLQPHTTNSTNLLVAQVNSGTGIGLQVTNGPATANWDLALSPFGGNVGIGTATPDDKLHVQGNITLTDSSPEITFETGASHYNWQLAAQENVNAAFDISVGSADGDASNDTFTNVFTVYQASSGYTLSSGSSRAPIFYDSDNTTYGVDPAGSTTLSFTKIYSTVPQLAIEDSNNGGGGGASGLITFRNTVGKAIGIGYTANETSNSDLIISTNAASTYGGYLGLDATAIADSQADIILDPKTDIRAYGNLTFGTPGGGQNTTSRFLSIEGNTDSSGEGSSRVFFAEHNSTTASMDNYGMSIAYRGGSSSITGASGNSISINTLGNGYWGLFGHNNSINGNLAMFGFRDGSYVQATGSFRAPIFYDSNDTAYYLDPNNTTKSLVTAGDIEIVSGTAVLHIRDSATNGNWSSRISFEDSVSIPGGTVANNSLEIGVSSGNQPRFDISGAFRFDTSLSKLYLSTSGAAYIQHNGNKLSAYSQYGYIDIGANNSTYAHITTDRGTFYFDKQIAFDGNIFGYGGTETASFATFYDSNNTGYYIDPSGASNVLSISVGGMLLEDSSDRSGLLEINPKSATSWSGIQIVNGQRWSFMGNNSNVGAYNDSTSEWIWLHYTNGDLEFYHNGAVQAATKSGYFQANNQMRSPIFYDSNNTAFYANPATAGNGTVLNGVKVNYLGVNASANTSGYGINMGASIDMNANNIDYVNQLHFNDNVRFYDNGDDSYLNFKYGDATLGGIKFINGSAVTTGYLYASTSGFGLLPPDGTWGVQVTNSYTQINHETRTPILYDSDDTTHYVDPASTTFLENGIVSAWWRINDGDGLRIGNGSDFRIYHSSNTTYFRNYNHGNGNMFWQGENPDGANQGIFYMYTDTTRTYSVLRENNAERFRTTSAGVTVTGQLDATGDVVAYSSDKRLKENIKNIESPLDKISKLNGVTFDWKNQVIDLGFNPRNKKEDVGVIAQEVEEIFPQIIAPAPFDIEYDTDTGEVKSKSGENYKTVQYEKLVPLLIEAVKELSEKVKILENK